MKSSTAGLEPSNSRSKFVFYTILLIGLLALIYWFAVRPRYQIRQWKEKLYTTVDHDDFRVLVQEMIWSSNPYVDQTFFELSSDLDNTVYAPEHRVLFWLDDETGQPYSVTRWSSSSMSPNPTAKFTAPEIVENLPMAVVIAYTNEANDAKCLTIFSYKHTGHVCDLTPQEFSEWRADGFWNHYVEEQGNPIAEKRKHWTAAEEESYQRWKNTMENRFGDPIERLRQKSQTPDRGSTFLKIENSEKSAVVEKDDRGHLVTASMIGFDNLTDKDVRQLLDFPELHTLTLRDSNLPEDGWHTLSKLSNLKRLYLVDTNVRNGDVEHLLPLKKLELLKLNRTQISNEGLKTLGRLTQLTSLNLSQTEIDDEGLKHLQNLRNLQALDLSMTNISDAGTTSLKPLKNITWLSMTNTRISDDTLKNLSEMTNLHDLWLHNTLISGDGLKNLTNSSKLRYVNLGNCPLNDDGIRRLKVFPSLVHLMIGKTDLTDACVDDLAAMKQLEALDLSATAISKAAIEELQEALPNCEINYDVPR